MGRPPKPEQLRRSNSYILRLTPTERAALDSAAGRLGVPVATILREGARLFIRRGKGESNRKEKNK